MNVLVKANIEVSTVVLHTPPTHTTLKELSKRLSLKSEKVKELPDMAVGDTDVGKGIALVLCTPLVLGSRVHHQPVRVVKAVGPTRLPLRPLLPEREC